MNLIFHNLLKQAKQLSWGGSYLIKDLKDKNNWEK